MARGAFPPRCREVWCIACRDIGMVVQDTPVPILIVLAQDGTIATASPLQGSSKKELQSVLMKAMQQPGAGPPRRPPR